MRVVKVVVDGRDHVGPGGIVGQPPWIGILDRSGGTSNKYQRKHGHLRHCEARGHRTLAKKRLVRSFDGEANTSRGSPSSTTIPSSMNTSRVPTSRANPIS